MVSIAFGPFELDTGRGTLLRDGAAVPLGGRAAAVLAALLAAQGRTVAKENLLAQAWPGTIVEDGNLTVQIATLRKALGLMPDGRDWIVTVPRVGYRLITAGPAEPNEDAHASAPVLAVLPFHVFGGESEADYFADGLVAEAVPKINKETEKENAEAYRLLTQALAIEPDNALLLAHAAWALSHRNAMGWPPIGEDDVQISVELTRRALQRAAGDPTVMAHCGMNLVHTAKDYDLGMAVLESAAKANPNNHMVVVCAGIAHLHCGTIEDSLAFFHRAIRLSPNDPLAHVPFTGIAHGYMVRGEYEEALAWALRSLALNTRFDPTYWMLIAANAHLGRMDEARRSLDELRAIAPRVTLASIRAGQPAKYPDRLAAILAGLRLAGLPEA